MHQAINLAYLPNKILNLKDPQEPLEENWFPFLMEKGVPGTPTTFVCKGFTCLPPVKNEKELMKIIG